ncbi:MAG: hypothetical protein PUB29_06980 [Bacteroidales bacterium]|nr:hypothetical protein [Bacteroidales bacterium]
MKNKTAIVLFCAFASLLLTQCKDIDLTADYKDITISYAILNPQDNIHYFKIYRGFITDQNALTEAGKWDNVYYPVDSIEVRLEEYRNGKIVRSAVLDTTTAVPQGEGYFPNPKQLLYFSDWQLDKESVYRLVIHRNTTGDEVYAETLMVGDFSIIRPIQSWNMTLSQPYKMKFSQADNAAMYDVFLTFSYVEVNNNTGEIEHKKVTKRLNGDYIRASSSADVTFNSFIPQTFFTTIVQAIETNPDVTRYTDTYKCLRLTVWAGDKNYLTYREVATPNSSIVQNNLEYTNFISENESALGLLASRNYTYVDLMLDNTTGHNEDTLVKSPRTERLNFDYYRNSPEFPGLK